MRKTISLCLVVFTAVSAKAQLFIAAGDSVYVSPGLLFTSKETKLINNGSIYHTGTLTLNGTSVQQTIEGPGTVQNLTADNNALLLNDLTVMDTLRVNEDKVFTIDTHRLTNGGTITGNGLLKASPNAELVLNGNGNSIVTMDSSVNESTNAFKNVIVNGSGNVNLRNKLYIYDALLPNAGNINVAGELVIRSGILQTARVGAVGSSFSYTGSGKFTIERYIPNNNFRSWRLLSVPTKSNQTINAAWQEGNTPMGNNRPGFGTVITAPSGGNGMDGSSATASMLRWNGTGWTGINSTLAPISAYKAYFLYVRGERTKGVTGLISDASATTLRTSGEIYYGDTTMTIAANSFAIVPNIYPSAIDFTGLTRTGGVANTFYIWDSKKLNGNSLGVYQTFSATNGFNCLIAGGSYTPGAPNTVIESGQAFFVQSTSAGTITFKESAKISGTSGSQGFRPSLPAAKPARVYTSLYSGDDMMDANVAVFDAAYDKSIGMEDAAKYANPGANFAIIKNGQLLAIDGSAPFSGKDSIRFYMWNMKKQEYTLNIDMQNIESSSPELTAVLEDRYLKNITPLYTGGLNSIKFTITSDSGSYDSRRFLIVFKKIARPPVANGYEYSISPNPVQNGIVNVWFSGNGSGQFTVRVFAGNGQSICEKTVWVNGSTKHTLQLPQPLAQGVYNVEIAAPGNVKTVKQILVQ